LVEKKRVLNRRTKIPPKYGEALRIVAQKMQGIYEFIGIQFLEERK